MGKWMRGAAVCAALGAGLPGLSPMALAQPAPPVRTPEVVPPPSELAPPLLQPRGGTALPESADPPRELGKPEDDLRLDVTAYRVDDGAPAALRAALPALTARYTGPQRSFEDLVNAANEVTRYLQRELGYYLGYAYVPEQTPGDGVIRIAVLEGRLDRVELNWRDGLPVDREVVEAYLARLRPGDVLRVRDVERVVFLVNDLRGMTSRFEVRAGSRPGTATLVVTPAPESIWSGKVEADANGSRFLGEYRIGGLAQWNSPFGRGDGFTANALASTTGGLGFALLGYTTPVGSDGIKLGASLSAVRYQLDEDIFQNDVNGEAATFNVYGLYPVVRSRNLNLFAIASAEHKTYEDRQERAGRRTEKTVDTIALGTAGDFRDSLLGGGVNTYDASIVSGRLNFPTGRDATLDDDETFRKLTLGYTRLQDLVTGRLLIYTALRAQLAFDNLDTTEQFRLGGPEGVRAFAAGEGTGDTGAILTAELRFLPPEDWIGRIAREMVWSVFVDAGHIKYRHRPQVNPDAPPNTGTFVGAGIGVSWVRPGEYAVRASLSRPISGTPRSDDQEKSVRLYLSASMFFQ